MLKARRDSHRATEHARLAYLPSQNLALVLDRKTFSGPVTCPACTRLVTIAYVASVGDREIRTFHWHCPHAACAGAGTFRLHGEFLGATAGPTDFDKKK